MLQCFSSVKVDYSSLGMQLLETQNADGDR